MLKRVLSILACALLLSACGQEKLPQTKNEPYYKFTDSTGTEVVLNRPPQKTAVLFSSYAELWLLAGGEIYTTVGDSVKRGFCPGSVLLVDDGAGRSINTELLLSYEPDFIIATTDLDGQRAACDIARAAGIPTALFKVETVKDYLSMLKICTDITNTPQAYEEYGTAVAEEIEAIKAKAHGKEKKILFIRAGGQASSTKAKRSEDHFAAAILEELGAYNIADNAKALLDGLSLEEVIKEDPDLIFIAVLGDEDAAKAYMKSVFESEGWKELRAVKEGNCHFLPKELFNYKPNARYAESYRYLARLLYQESDI